MTTYNQVRLPNTQSTSLLFHYLYRDTGNYKQQGSVALACPADTAVEAATAAIEKLLIDGQYFVAEQVGLPVLRKGYDAELDHGWHEFSYVELGGREDVPGMDYLELLERLELCRVD